MMDRPIVLITGACGGMGRACARVLGRDWRLALSDRDLGQVGEFARSLESEGHCVVATHAGDYMERAVPAAAIAAARAAGQLDGLVHTVGLSPIQASWDRILITNAIATELVLQAAEADPHTPPDTVLIASISGHHARARPHVQLDVLLDAPLRDHLLDVAEPLLRTLADPAVPLAMEGQAYSYSKSAVLRSVERRAAAWGRAGRRITTISPGVTHTPMGIAEMEGNAIAKATAEGAPLGVVPAEAIAHGVAFLLSPLAASVTGTDLRIDGGLMAALHHPAPGGR
jgi:NAD(P)-dependent dehydrogenase (short-subunit alcohol dehydrogenase family)